jgi:hypothetical protein
VSLACALGCLYLAAYGAWAWLFRTRVDSRVRSTLGRRLGVEVSWVRASTFPLEIWVWDLGGRGAKGDRSLRGSRVALGCLTLCLTGAFAPVGGLCLFLSKTPRLASALGPALYLTTPWLILLFVVSHMGGRESKPSSERRPSLPPPRLDTGRES